MTLRHALLFVTLGLGYCGNAFAQKLPSMDPKIAAVLRAFDQKMDITPDLPGTGSHPAIKRVDPWFPDHVIYRPADLGRLSEKLPVLLWGNGGCANDGASGRHHLLEIASHGYFAIAPGPIMSGPDAPPKEDRPKPAPFVPGKASQQTSWKDVDAGLDLAERANTDPKSPYYHRLDTSRVAVGGHSCGGLQALNVALHDPRITTLLVHDSGIFINAPFPIEEGLKKTDLARLSIPTIYVEGGPSDIAYDNGVDDFRYIVKARAVFASIDRGHTATFDETNGGAVAQVAVDWLDWVLKGDKRAALRFVGSHCIMCTDPEWTIEKKNIPG